MVVCASCVSPLPVAVASPIVPPPSLSLDQRPHPSPSSIMSHPRLTDEDSRGEERRLLLSVSPNSGWQ